MAVLSAIFVLLFGVYSLNGYVLMSDDDHEIVWPLEYHFNVEKISFDTTIKTPMEIWFNTELDRGRVDYFGGIDRLHYTGKRNLSFVIYPKPNSNMEVEVKCRPSFDDDEDFEMPDVSYLSYTGETISIFDKIVDVWTGKHYDDDSETEDLQIEETLYIHRTDKGVDIPVQHIIKKINEAKGVIKKHTVTNYYNYQDSVPEEVFHKDDAICHPFFDFETDIDSLLPDIPDHLNHAFESYAIRHGKEYHEKERQMRKSIFEKNWRMVQEHNSKNLGFKLEINEFSDRTPEELKHLTGLLDSGEPPVDTLPFPHTLEEIDDIVKQLPKNFDLRIEGAISAVKNQANCGSCWAFATTAGLEGAFARVNGDRLLDLSEQSIVDCAWNEGNMGCHGGLLNDAWMYVIKNGIPTEEEYGEYMAQDGECHISNMTKLYKIKGFAAVTPRNPDALKVALYKYGPVTIGVHATDLMLAYSSGLFYDFSCENYSRPNHAVTIVGYGNRDGEDYWIIKNSWGESWGEDGYILMSAKKNNCFVLDYPCYPIV